MTIRSLAGAFNGVDDSRFSILAAYPGVYGADFVPLATVNATGSATSFTFTAIPGTYQHLQLRVFCRSADSGTSTITVVGFRVNGDTGTNYDYRRFYGDGGAVFSEAVVNVTYGTLGGFNVGQNAAANAYGAGVIDFLDYSATNKIKSYRSVAGADRSTGGTAGVLSGAWRNVASPITSIEVLFFTTPTTASTMSLYGIKAP